MREIGKLLHRELNWGLVGKERLGWMGTVFSHQVPSFYYNELTRIYIVRKQRAKVPFRLHCRLSAGGNAFEKKIPNSQAMLLMSGVYQSADKN